MGDGNRTNPYQIESLENLYWLSKADTAWSRHYIQTADIDASDTYNWVDEMGYSGLTPIGKDFGFTGNFNGSGYTIKNLYINSDMNVGLFGMIEGATLDSIGIVDCEIFGFNMIGGLIGESFNSTISHCYVTGSITSESETVGGLIAVNSESTVTSCFTSCTIKGGEGFVGGLVGENFDTPINYCHSSSMVYGKGQDIGGLIGMNGNSDLTNCFSSGLVSSEDTNIGGLVGTNARSNISNCYTSCDVYGYAYVGGLIGFNSSNEKTITNCYNTGNVTATYSAGGLIGRNYYTSISNCYSTGIVSASSSAGTIIGVNQNNGTVTNSFFNSETCNTTVAIGSDYNNQTVDALNSSSMKLSDSFDNWDFNDVWTIRTDSTYPVLQSVENNAPFAFADTVIGSLSTLLQNDYDYELVHSNLTVKVDSFIKLPDGANYFKDLSDLENGDSIRIIYHVGEIRNDIGDTLIGNSVISFLKIDNTSPVFTPIDTLKTIEDNNISVDNIVFATDQDGDVLEYLILNNGKHGSASYSDNHFTYFPDQNFYGIDSIQISANDQLSEVSQWIYINVYPENDRPVAKNSTIETPEDNNISIAIDTEDIDGQITSIVITSEPLNGQVSVSDLNVVYSPNENYFGADEFSWYAVDDSSEISEIATVSINVTSINDLPIAYDSRINTPEDKSVTIETQTYDVDGTISSIVITNEPNHGIATISGTNIIYEPEPDYFGSDLFSWYAIDNENGTSNDASVEINIAPINDAPIVSGSNVETNEDTEVIISLDAKDIDGEISSLILAEEPSNGIATISGNEINYTPHDDFNGMDQITWYAIDDSSSVSELALINIDVKAINDIPSAYNQEVSTVVDSVIIIATECSDIDGNISSIGISKQPTHGVAIVSELNVVYIPAKAYQGADEISWYAIDNEGAQSTDATISINVSEGFNTGFSSIQAKQIALFPNPADDYFGIKGFNGSIKINLYTTSGEVISTHTISGNEKIDVSNLLPGTYIVQIQLENGVVSKIFNKK